MQTEHGSDESDSCTDCTITESKKRKICIDGTKTENEFRGKRKRDYPLVTEVILKKQKTLHTSWKKRKRNGKVYRNNRQKKKKHEIIVIDYSKTLKTGPVLVHETSILADAKERTPCTRKLL